MTALFDAAALLVPIACFVIVVRRTRHLRSDDPAVLPRGGAVAYGPTPAVLGVITIVLLMLGFIGGWRCFSFGTGLWMLLCGARIAEYSHARVAARGVIVPGLMTVVLYVACLGLMAFSHGSEVSTQAAWLGCLALALYAGLRPLAHAAARRPSSLLPRPVILALLLLGVLVAWNRTVYAEPEGLRTYVERFDADLDELNRWQHTGRIAAWLASQGIEPDLSEPRARLHAALARGVDVHPSTLKGAIAAGLLGPAQYRGLIARQSPHRTRRALAAADERYIWTLSMPVELRARIEAGNLTEDERATVAHRLSLSWPAEPGIGNLEDAREICELLDRLGRRDLIDRQRAALHALLQRSWGDEVPWFATSGGFTSDDRPDEVHAPDDESCVDALDLMGWVGVPDGIDPARLERHARAELRPSILLHGFGLSRFDALSALTLNRVRAEHDTRAPWTTRVREWTPLLGLVLLLLLVVVLTLRAPDVAITVRTEGAGASDGAE